MDNLQLYVNLIVAKTRVNATVGTVTGTVFGALIGWSFAPIRAPNALSMFK